MRSSSCLHLVIFFLCASLINFSLTNTTEQFIPGTYRYHFCLGANYTADSTYGSNLAILLSSLSFNSNTNSIKTNEFYNTTVGQNQDTIYGSFQCNNGELTSQECGACVNTATQAIRYRCPVSKQAVIFYDGCTLRYSDRFFFSIRADSPAVYLSNTANVSNPDRFNRILGGLLSDLRTDAVAPSSINTLFATGERNITNIEKVYGLVQCTSDLNPTSCNMCLLRVIVQLPRCCNGKQGGRVNSPSCNFRYEIYPFLKERVNASLPPAPSPPEARPTPEEQPRLPPSTSMTTSSNGKGKSSTKSVLFITSLQLLHLYLL